MEIPMHVKFLVPLAAIVLAACTGAAGLGGTASADLAPPPPDECQARALGRYLSGPPTEDIKAASAAQGGDRRIRYIAPGQAVTMDYLVFRLNVETGKDGRIKRFYCG